MTTRYLPMTAVAGDYYDVRLLSENRLAVFVADVSGHGVPAALVASMLKVALNSAIAGAPNPGRVLSLINSTLYEELGSNFVTAGLCIIDTEQKQLSYAGAGHPPLVISRNGTVELVDSQNGIIGPFPEIAGECKSIELSPGDRIFSFTDGIVEVMNEREEFFGIEGVVSFLKEHQTQDIHALADEFVSELRAWVGNNKREDTFDDDVTLVIVEITKSQNNA